MRELVECYIGLGSNLSNPAEQVDAAIVRLNRLPETSLVARSSLYASQPMGPKNQPDFINAVAKIQTGLEPHALLLELLKLELQLGRKRSVEHVHFSGEQSEEELASGHWGARVIDLDLLLYGDQVVCSAQLSVPHPGLLERDFVVFPLLELSPNILIPNCGLLANHVDSVASYHLKKLDIETVGIDSSR